MKNNKFLSNVIFLVLGLFTYIRAYLSDRRKAGLRRRDTQKMILIQVKPAAAAADVPKELPPIPPRARNTSSDAPVPIRAGKTLHDVQRQSVKHDARSDATRLWKAK